VSHFRFLDHQNLRINLQKGFTPRPPTGASPLDSTEGPPPRSPVMQILNISLHTRQHN